MKFGPDDIVTLRYGSNLIAAAYIGDIQVWPQATNNFFGQLHAISGQSSHVTEIRALIAALQGTSNLQSHLLRMAGLAGVSPATSTLEADLLRLKLLAGTLNGVSDASVIASINRMLSAVAAATSGSVSAMGIVKAFAAIDASVSTITGALNRIRGIEGIAAAASAAVAALTVTKSITIVGAIAGAANNGGDVTLSFAGFGLQENDIIVVAGGHTRTSFVGPVTAGYSVINDPGQINNNHMAAHYKFMGAVPDTDVLCEGTGSTNDAVVYCATAFRNVNLTTPLDVAATVFSEANAVPNPPSITTVTNRCMIVVCALNSVDDTTINPPTGYAAMTLGVNYQSQVDTNSRSAAMTYAPLVTAGAHDPGPFVNWAAEDYTAMTIALRPA